VTTLFGTGLLVAVANADAAGPADGAGGGMLDLNDRVGPAAQAALLDSAAAGELQLTDLVPGDVARMAQLVRTYHDLRLDPPTRQ
jgi:hypothetical protein